MVTRASGSVPHSNLDYEKLFLRRETYLTNLMALNIEKEKRKQKTRSRLPNSQKVVTGSAVSKWLSKMDSEVNPPRSQHQSSVSIKSFAHYYYNNTRPPGHSGENANGANPSINFHVYIF